MPKISNYDSFLLVTSKFACLNSTENLDYPSTTSEITLSNDDMQARKNLEALTISTESPSSTPEDSDIPFHTSEQFNYPSPVLLKIHDPSTQETNLISIRPRRCQKCY
ncbi:hypothetical protein CDAR_471611 [Caerostris darwini]|uniref:Uncharacterized protein n=1 Tax=Caerostris darwini TaxID=1538125 RepID=A0AAV4PWD4_9ARAC|nr:hypothetical protein CDAR_471611 [Caerostris darwini]